MFYFANYVIFYVKSHNPEKSLNLSKISHFEEFTDYTQDRPNLAILQSKFFEIIREKSGNSKKHKKIVKIVKN